MGLGTMTVLHDANVEGSDTILNGVYAGGFESLVEATRQVNNKQSHRECRFRVPYNTRDRRGAYCIYVHTLL